ncbi:MAG: single-stranded DNA-binding protein, partial [Synergistaceae bacterium]|nr:single-stranded DNA-binding protein [Synergistaceae bacterium]
MARDLNKVILLGNLARDPELRYSVDKRAMARFAVAVNRSWKDRSGELQESV